MRSSVQSQQASRQFFAVLTAILVVATPFTTTAQASQPGFSGADLFRGLLLGQGPVADLFPEIWDEVQEINYGSVPYEKYQEVELAIADYVDSILASIDNQNPAYFDHFATEIQSGDHLRIESAIVEGSYLLLEIVAANLGVTPEELKPFEPGLIGVAAVVVLAAAVAVVTLTVVATQLAAALWAISIVAVYNYVAAIETRVGVRQSFDPSHSNLAREIWIDWIATRLAS